MNPLQPVRQQPTRPAMRTGIPYQGVATKSTSDKVIVGCSEQPGRQASGEAHYNSGIDSACGDKFGGSVKLTGRQKLVGNFKTKRANGLSIKKVLNHVLAHPEEIPGSLKGGIGVMRTLLTGKE